VLRRLNGRIGCASETAPRNLQLVFQVGDTNFDDSNHSWSEYFPLQFRKFRRELPLAYRRCANAVDGDVVGYALFPKRFESLLETEIRAEGVQRRLAGKITGAEIRFDATADIGFRVQHVKVSIVAKNSNEQGTR